MGWPRSAFGALFAISVMVTPAQAADDPCGTFKWQLSRERAWLTGTLDDHAVIDDDFGAAHRILDVRKR